MKKEGGGDSSACSHSFGSDSSDSTKEVLNSSRDLMEDASSSTSSLKGPLYELSELMAQLPIKRGLSKYYDGKSQSFKSLGSVKSLEDLAKEENPYNKRMKLCRSYVGGHKNHRGFCTPKPTIAKKASPRTNSCLSSGISMGTTSSFSSFVSKPVQLQKQI